MEAMSATDARQLGNTYAQGVKDGFLDDVRLINYAYSPMGYATLRAYREGYEHGAEMRAKLKAKDKAFSLPPAF